MRTTRSAVAFAAAALAVLASGATPAVAVGELPHRPESTPVHTVAGHWVAPVKGYLGGDWLLFHRGDTVTLQGQGYFLVRWEIEYWRGTGVVSMPTYTGQQGTFLHVASAGHRMDAPVTGGEPGQTWMGKPSTGFETLPAGTPMIWVNEYYYLDGTITITCQEAENGQNGRYNLGIAPKSWQQVDSDVHPAGNGTVGLVLDQGAATTPSPSASPSASSAASSAPGLTPASGAGKAPQTATPTLATPITAKTAPVTPAPVTTASPAADAVGGTPSATDSAGAQESASAAGSSQATHLAPAKAGSVGPLLAAAGLGLVALCGGLLWWWRRRRSEDAR